MPSAFGQVSKGFSRVVGTVEDRAQQQLCSPWSAPLQRQRPIRGWSEADQRFICPQHPLLPPLPRGRNGFFQDAQTHCCLPIVLETPDDVRQVIEFALWQPYYPAIRILIGGINANGDIQTIGEQVGGRGTDDAFRHPPFAHVRDLNNIVALTNLLMDDIEQKLVGGIREVLITATPSLQTLVYYGPEERKLGPSATTTTTTTDSSSSSGVATLGSSSSSSGATLGSSSSSSLSPTTAAVEQYRLRVGAPTSRPVNEGGQVVDQYFWQLAQDADDIDVNVDNPGQLPYLHEDATQYDWKTLLQHADRFGRKEVYNQLLRGRRVSALLGSDFDGFTEWLRGLSQLGSPSWPKNWHLLRDFIRGHTFDYAHLLRHFDIPPEHVKENALRDAFAEWFQTYQGAIPNETRRSLQTTFEQILTAHPLERRRINHADG